MDIGAFLSALTNFSAAIRLIEDYLGRNDSTRNSLLLELKENISIIELYKISGSPIDSVILQLKTETMKKTLESNFNFNHLKGTKVPRSATGDVAFFSPYIGKTTRELFQIVYLRISELQRVVQIDPDNPNIRKSVRLINIFKLIKFILVHLGEKDAN